MNYVNDVNIELRNNINENSYVTNYSVEEQVQRLEYFWDNRVKLLELELTETFFVHPDSIEVMQLNIKKLHEYGFKVAMDDFGSGISTLSMLGHLDID